MSGLEAKEVNLNILKLSNGKNCGFVYPDLPYILSDSDSFLGIREM